MTPKDERLQRLLGGPELAALRQRLRRHYERHPAGQAPVTLQLTGLNPLEQERLAAITGRPVRPARSLRLDLAAIGAALHQAGLCATLQDALVLLDGPLTDRQADQAEQRQAWARIAAGQPPATTAAASPIQDSRLLAWLQTTSAITLLKRLCRSQAAQAHACLIQAQAVLSHLPAKGMPRAQISALALGDAHGLDAGQTVARIVLATLRASTHGETPEDDRANWAQAGVLVNELARPVLCLNLPTQGDTSAVYGGAGEPAYLSLRQLLRSPPSWAVSGRTVLVCENPNLLAIAADRLGSQCPPWVCTEGMPAAAQSALLDQLAAAGAQFAYHGDFDWPGIRIANHILQRWPACPWAMNPADYQAAVAQAPQRPPDLGEGRVEASWCPDLANVMQHHGWKVAEEAVADALLTTLPQNLASTGRCAKS